MVFWSCLWGNLAECSWAWAPLSPSRSHSPPSLPKDMEGHWDLSRGRITMSIPSQSIDGETEAQRVQTTVPQ